jgi:transcriptional regulator with XRE-family HTH domain
MPDRDVDPTVYRRRLRNILRRERESRGITQTTAAEAMAWSVSKLIRIETGTVTISVNDLKMLLAHYGITDPGRVNELVEMSKASREHSWLWPYRGIASDVFLTFLGHEEAAVRSYSFQPILVPGLLQTDEYAATVLQVIRGPRDANRLNRLRELRIARQERVLSRTDPIELNYLLDESVVRRAVGGRTTMKSQINHLIDSCEKDNLRIRIIPFSMGIYRSIRLPYVVLEFSDPADNPVLYLEYPHRESLIKEDGPFDQSDAEAESPTHTTTTHATPTDVSAPTTPPTYLQIFSELQQHTSEEQTLQILRSALTEMDS